MPHVDRIPARERILDAAASVMREKGLAKTTTKAIAAAAGVSEALLYKYFADKQELFLLVLTERMPSIELPDAGSEGGDLETTLTALIARLMEFFRQTFPIAGSIFGSPELLAQHRDGVQARGFGPTGPIKIVQGYLGAEQDAGRVKPDADLESAARAVVGAAFHQGFLAAFEGLREIADAKAVASGIAEIVLPALVDGGAGRGR